MKLLVVMVVLIGFYRCWIDKDHPMLRASMYYIPLMVIWIYNIVIYFKIMRQVNRYMSFVKKKAYMRLLMFLLVSIVTNLPGTICFQRYIRARN